MNERYVESTTPPDGIAMVLVCSVRKRRQGSGAQDIVRDPASS